MNTTALITGIFEVIVTVIYLVLGYRLATRTVSPAVRLPSAQFALFWLGLGAVSIGSGFESLWATGGVPPLTVVVTVQRLEVLVICAALWGLLGYLTYLYTGRHGLALWSVFYGVLYIALLFLISAYRPMAVVVTNGTVGLQYGTAFAGPLLTVLFLVLIAPEFIGAVLYFTLIFRSHDRTVRFRVTTVSWSLILWLGISVLGAELGLGSSLPAELFLQALGALAALAIFIAYYPPRALRERLGITAVDSPKVA